MLIDWPGTGPVGIAVLVVLVLVAVAALAVGDRAPAEDQGIGGGSGPTT